MSGGASIIVTGVLMTVDAECSVAISSLSEGECSMTTTAQSSTDNTAAVIGGVVAVILIIAITIIIIAIVALIMKSRPHGDLSIRKAEE